MTEVHKLPTRGINAYDIFRYDYDLNLSGPNSRCLTAVYDARGVRQLLNEYGDGIITGTQPRRLWKQTDGALKITTFSITDTVGVPRRLQVSNALSQTTTINHAPSGGVTDVISPVPGETAPQIEYDSRGRVLREKTTSGEWIAYEYDEFDRVIARKIDNATIQQTTRAEYDYRGNPLWTQDANGNSSSFNYDSLGRLTKSTDAGNAVTSYTYDPTWKALVASETVIPALAWHSVSRSYVYHGTTGDLTSETQTGATVPYPEPGLPGVKTVTVTYAYDANGNRTQEDRPALVNNAADTLVTRYKYDAQNRLVATEDPLGTSTGSASDHFSGILYDPDGRQIMTTNSLGVTTSYTYDMAGRLIETLYEDGTVSRTLYDELT